MGDAALTTTRREGDGRRRSDSLVRLREAARKIFVERGYHAARPQDIAREAGLGHGTFYLHYPDKRACFLAFVEAAREELDVYLRASRGEGQTLEQQIAATINAIYDYSEIHPGVLRAAMADEGMIDAEGACTAPLLARWGATWAEFVLASSQRDTACRSFDAQIIGQAIAGALYQTGREGWCAKRPRRDVTDNLARFIARALAPG